MADRRSSRTSKRDPRLDAIYALDPARWAEEAGGIRLDKWQRGVLGSRSRRKAIVAPRQSGKSTIAAIALAHTAVYRPGSTCLALGSAERQARLLLRRTKAFLRSVDAAYSTPVQRDAETLLQLKNGAEVVALPTAGDSIDAIRGYSVNGMIAVDEAEFALDQVDEEGSSELLGVTLPMLAVSGGGMLLMSSAGWEGSPYHRVVEGRTGNFEVRTVDVEECPRLTPSALADLEGTLGRVAFEREVLCRWSTRGFSPISLDAFRASAQDDDVTVDLRSVG